MQVLTRRRADQFRLPPREHWGRIHRLFEERILAKAVHRVTAEDVSPERAADEAIARIKQILSE
jgi:hypothetical protein